MIENTADRDPLLHLAGAFGGTSRYIEDMEAAGQSQLVHSDRLPVKTQNDEAEFLALGFTFGAPDPSDRIFRPATLPEGWKRQPSDHSMWSHLVDAKGRKRVAIFYKAAFYDRSAFMRLETIHGRVMDLVYGEIDAPPVDDDWLTRDAWITALTEYRDRAEAEATEMESYYPPGAATRREHIAVCDKHLANLTSSKS